MWGDDSLFGVNQPSGLKTGTQRSRQAMTITRFVDEWLSWDSHASIIVLGDLNELEYRSPMRILTSRGLVHLVDHLPEADRYTFNYRGNSHLRDYMVVSSGLLQRATVQIDILHVNADRPESIRASDHDPVLIEIEFRQ